MKNLLIIIVAAFCAVSTTHAQTTTTLDNSSGGQATPYETCLSTCQEKFPTEGGASQVACIQGCALQHPAQTAPASLPTTTKELPIKATKPTKTIKP